MVRLQGEGPKKLVDDYLKVLERLVARASGFDVERILLPIGNDGMNSEGLRKSTTAGTYKMITWDGESLSVVIGN